MYFSYNFKRIFSELFDISLDKTILPEFNQLKKNKHLPFIINLFTFLRKQDSYYNIGKYNFYDNDTIMNNYDDYKHFYEIGYRIDGDGNLEMICIIKNNPEKMFFRTHIPNMSWGYDGLDDAQSNYYKNYIPSYDEIRIFNEFIDNK